MLVSKDKIKDHTGRIVGWIETDHLGNKTARDFYGKIKATSAFSCGRRACNRRPKKPVSGSGYTPGATTCCCCIRPAPINKKALINADLNFVLTFISVFIIVHLQTYTAPTCFTGGALPRLATAGTTNTCTGWQCLHHKSSNTSSK